MSHYSATETQETVVNSFERRQRRFVLISVKLCNLVVPELNLWTTWKFMLNKMLQL